MLFPGAAPIFQNLSERRRNGCTIFCRTRVRLVRFQRSRGIPAASTAKSTPAACSNRVMNSPGSDAPRSSGCAVESAFLVARIAGAEVAQLAAVLGGISLLAAVRHIEMAGLEVRFQFDARGEHAG